MSTQKMNRREFLSAAAMTAAGVAVVACQPQTVVVKETVEVEKVVKETVEVEKEVTKVVEKEVTKVVKEVVEVEKVSPRQAPALQEMVRAGTLPPLEERAPLEPLVVTPIEEVGTYGGTWRQLHMGMVDSAQNSYLLNEPISKWTLDFTQGTPNAAKGWEFSDGGKVLTIYLRKGSKWNDGAPFTADDVLYWYEDVVGNDELSPAKPGRWKRAGEMGEMEKVDDYTYKVVWAKAYGAFEDQLTDIWTPPYQPGHYLKEFHADYADKAELDKKIEDADVDTWTELYGIHTTRFDNPGTPVMMPWAVQNGMEEPLQILPRNAYYWKVDTEGNQLPYIDQVERTLLPDTEAILLKAIAGDCDNQGRRVASLANRPVVIESQEKGDYRVINSRDAYIVLEKGGIAGGTNFGTIQFNFHHKDEELKNLFHELDFRIALSIAIDRDQISTLLFKGQAVPSQYTTSFPTPWWEESFTKAYIEYDPDKANEILDGLGLDVRDAEGYRLLPSGKRLSLVNLAFTPWPAENVEMQELVKADWEKIGVEQIVKPTDRALWVTQVHATEHDLASYAINLGYLGTPPIMRECFFVTDHHMAPLWGLWYMTDGAEGEEPPDEVKEVQSMYETVLNEPSAEKRTELQKQAVSMHAKYIWAIGLVAGPALGGFRIVKHYFRNVPEGEDFFTKNVDHAAQYFIRK